MTKEQEQLYRDIAEKYELNKTHFFKHNHYVILNKYGINKIAADLHLTFEFEILETSEIYSAVRCYTNTSKKVLLERDSLITYASASKLNSNNAYYLEMAIKRAKSKGVLEYIDVYDLGVYAEVEGTFEEEKSLT